ncbi:hypothetical protein KVV02_001784, partial [Mortierella alpina]
HKKAQETSAGVTITEIEDNLPSLRGDDAHVEGYVSRVKDVEATLVKFYSDDDRESWERHNFYLKKAFDEEFQVVANSLLKMVGMVGGTSSAPREENYKVLIAIGLGDFGSNNTLSSLHTSFKKYFVELAKSSGYIVCGVNEFYTSRRCPRCEQFVGQVTLCRSIAVPPPARRSPARQTFAQYLKARGWMVMECETEANLSSGNDCQPGDVVATRNSGRCQKHSWDSRRATEAKYAAAADQLLKMVGGSIGERGKYNNVLFGNGLGKFSSTSGLTSLHSSF